MGWFYQNSPLTDWRIHFTPPFTPPLFRTSCAKFIFSPRFDTFSSRVWHFSVSLWHFFQSSVTFSTSSITFPSYLVTFLRAWLLLPRGWLLFLEVGYFSSNSDRKKGITYCDTPLYSIVYTINYSIISASASPSSSRSSCFPGEAVRQLSSYKRCHGSPWDVIH